MDNLSTPAETSNNNNEISTCELNRNESAEAYSWRPDRLDVWERNAHLTLPEPPAPVRYFLHVMAPALYDEVVL